MKLPIYLHCINGRVKCHSTHRACWRASPRARLFPAREDQFVCAGSIEETVAFAMLDRDERGEIVRTWLIEAPPWWSLKGADHTTRASDRGKDYGPPPEGIKPIYDDGKVIGYETRDARRRTVRQPVPLDQCCPILAARTAWGQSLRDAARHWNDSELEAMRRRISQPTRP